LDIKAVSWDPQKHSPPIPDGTWDTAIVTVRNYDDALKAVEYLRSGKHPFNSVVVDSISELQQKLIEKLTHREAMKQQDWGEILRAFLGLMRDFRDLTEHPIKPLSAVVLVAMTKAGPEGKYHAHLQGQAATTIPYLVDIQAATHVQTWMDDMGSMQRVHRLLVGANELYETGERVGGRLSSYLDNPTVPAVLDAIFGPEKASVAVEAVV
jgi:hypothetical protein